MPHPTDSCPASARERCKKSRKCRRMLSRRSDATMTNDRNGRLSGFRQLSLAIGGETAPISRSRNGSVSLRTASPRAALRVPALRRSGKTCFCWPTTPPTPTAPCCGLRPSPAPARTGSESRRWTGRAVSPFAAPGLAMASWAMTTSWNGR